MYGKMICKIIGVTLCTESVFLLPPLLLAGLDGDRNEMLAFLGTMLLCVFLGLPLRRTKLDGRKMQQRDGFATVALCWLTLTICGAMPYCFSGAVSSFANAFFESASGFSTTGATIFADVEALSRSILFWRAETQWLGGVGVLVLMVAMLPKLGEGSVNLMRAESPGPIKNKILPKASKTARVLYAIYITLTIVEALTFLLLGLPWFDSVTLALSTVSTGGFSIHNAGIAFYRLSSLYWVLVLFMFLSGVHFSVLYLAWHRKWRTIWQNEELRVYLGFILGASLLLCLEGSVHHEGTLSELVCSMIFQVVALLTTTGFFTMDYTQWTTFAQMMVLFLMPMGANAGSTAGGLKTARLILLVKSAWQELRHLISPREVRFAHLNGVRVETGATTSASLYFFLYCLTVAVLTLVLSVDTISPMAAFGAALSAVSNVGPSFAELGPMGNYAALSPLSKYALSCGMLMGRLELLPFLVLLSPKLWQK